MSSLCFLPRKACRVEPGGVIAKGILMFCFDFSIVERRAESGVFASLGGAGEWLTDRPFFSEHPGLIFHTLRGRPSRGSNQQ